MERCKIICGDWVEVMRSLPAESVQCVVTSPPYWGLRDYGIEPCDWPEVTYTLLPWCSAITVPAMRCCLGLEPSPEQFVGHIVHGFREVRRVLREDGTCWVNLGDSYIGGFPGIGAKPKDLVMVPAMVAMALRSDGWYLRSDVIWNKPNPMPESVTDRPTKAHEYLFLLSKSREYFYDAEAVREKATYYDPRMDDPDYEPQRKERDQTGSAGRGGGPLNRKTDKQRGHSRRHAGFNERWDAMDKKEEASGGRNKRSVWTVTPAQFTGAHFATFPPKLIEPCILAGTSAKGACAQCGAPWERILESGAPDLEHQRACGGDANGEYDGKATKDFGLHGAQDASSVKTRILAGMVEKQTVGWKPTCRCEEAATVPCVVLDPFGGSGTTGMVANGHGRNAILIERKAEYCEMAQRRCMVTEQDLKL